MALGEMADRRERSRLRKQELDPLLDRRVGRQQAESAAEPPCCAGRCSMRRRLAGGAQRLDGGQIALTCGALDVVRSSRGGCAAVVERASRPLVGAESPACRRRLVDGAPHERVAETEAPRYVGLAHEAELQQLVEGLDCTCLGCRGGGRRELWLERVARDRRSFQHQTRLLRQQAELLCQRGGDRGRDVDVAEPELSTRACRLPALPTSSGRGARGRTDCRRSPRGERRPSIHRRTCRGAHPTPSG